MNQIMSITILTHYREIKFFLMLPILPLKANGYIIWRTRLCKVFQSLIMTIATATMSTYRTKMETQSKVVIVLEVGDSNDDGEIRDNISSDLTEQLPDDPVLPSAALSQPSLLLKANHANYTNEIKSGKGGHIEKDAKSTVHPQ